MTYTILGTCDNVTDCDCCGRSNLKRTVALDDGHGVTYFGTACASKATKRSQGYVTSKAKAHKVLTCEECACCRNPAKHRRAPRYVGSLGRILCPDCVDSHSKALLGE